VKGNYAYVAAGEAGVRVINISNLSAPVSVPFNDGIEDYATGLDIRGDYLYVTDRTKGLFEYNIVDNPEKPTSEGVEVEIPGQANDVIVRGKIAYVAGGDTGFHVVDFAANISDPPVYSIQTKGTATGVFILDDYAYVADASEGFQIISISNPEDLRLVGSVNTPGEAVSVYVIKQTDSSSANRLYAFVADGSHGLYITDVTDYNNPVEVATYETNTYVSDVIVQDETAYLAEREEGLLILDVSTITEPKRKGNQDTPGEAHGLFLRDDNTVFIADGDRGLRIIDAKDQTNPEEIGFLDVPKLVKVMVARYPYGYTVDGKEGLWVLDLTDPGNPVPISFFKTPGDALNLTVLENTVYIADGASGLQVVDVSNPQRPVSMGAYQNIQRAVGVAVQDEYAYVISEGQKLYILNLSNLNEIKEESSFNTGGNALDVGIYDNHVYLAEGVKGLEIVNVENPKEPTPVKFSDNLNLVDPQAIWVMGSRDQLFIADGAGGLKTFNIDSTVPVPVFNWEIESGLANSLTVDGNYLFMTAEQNGVLMFDIYDLESITFAGKYQPFLDQDAESNQEQFLASSIAVVPETSLDSKRFIVYVPTGVLSDPSLQTFQADGKAKITQFGMFESPGEANLRQVASSFFQSFVGFMAGNRVPIQQKVWDRLGYICFGTLMFFFLSGLWLVLLAQFVLPVQTVRDGYKAVTRLLASIRGRHGPVVFIREGEIIHRQDELDRPGPGVARVDLNSAIVLEKRSLMQPQYRRVYTKYVRREQKRGRNVPRARVEGPGVVFIEPYESIHGVADLRNQFRIRPGVRAYTRDGIEIENPVWILFTLGQTPEVLDVTYEGERKPENLRVVRLGETKILARESIQHLDEENARFYQRYQRTRRFFQKAKERASLDIVAEEWVSSWQDQSYAADYIARLKQDAERWNISPQIEVREFIQEVEAQVSALDIGDPDEVELLINNINLLADRAMGEVMADFYDHDFQGKKQRGIVVKTLVDELDPDDREEIHRYVQEQTAIRFFSNVKSQAAKINYQSQASDGVQAYLRKITHLAHRWGLQNREDIRSFIDNISLLFLEIDIQNRLEVRWFAYHVCVIADEISNPAMGEYYADLYPELVKRYQAELRDLMKTRGLSRFARQAMDDSSKTSVADDAQRIYALNALDLWQSVDSEFIERLEQISDDPENQVEMEMIQGAQMSFKRVTDNLVRTDFPFIEAYSIVAELHTCIDRMRETVQQLNLRLEFTFPDFLKLFPVQRMVKKIQKTVLDLDEMGGPSFERYLDFIEIYDYVQSVRSCISAFRRANNEDRRGSKQLRPCVTRIKQQTLALERLSDSSYRRPVRQLSKWAEALSDQDPAQVYFFSRKLDGLWRKTETADQLAIRRYFRQVKAQLGMIQRDIRQFGARTKNLSGIGEIRQYQYVLDRLVVNTQDCSIPPRMINPGSSGGEQIRIGPFQFVRRRVLAAIYSKALDLDQEGEYMPWTDLPVHAAAQTFRDLVSREQYDYLYEPKDAHKFNMPKLKANFSRRMRNQGVLAFRFIDHIDGVPLNTGSEFVENELIRYESRELKGPKVLRVRGVKVIASGFPDLFPVSRKVPEQLLETWRAPWESKAMDVRGQHQLQAVRVINQARAQAQRDMAHTLARILQSSHSEEALAMRVFQALEATAVDADTRQFLPRDTAYLLHSFKQWFLPEADDRPKRFGDLDQPDDQPLLEE
jgi:hypothetical protein